VSIQSGVGSAEDVLQRVFSKDASAVYKRLQLFLSFRLSQIIEECIQINWGQKRAVSTIQITSQSDISHELSSSQATLLAGNTSFQVSNPIASEVSPAEEIQSLLSMPVRSQSRSMVQAVLHSNTQRQLEDLMPIDEESGLDYNAIKRVTERRQAQEDVFRNSIEGSTSRAGRVRRPSRTLREEGLVPEAERQKRGRAVRGQSLIVEQSSPKRVIRRV
jgi:hypothetical protein